MTKEYSSEHLHNKALYDTFSGMINCIVLEVVEEGTGKICNSGKILVKLTVNRGAYKRGEILSISADDCIPRKQMFIRDHKYRINTDYKWVKKNKN